MPPGFVFRLSPTKLGDNVSYRQWSWADVGFLPILPATLREPGGVWARTRRGVEQTRNMRYLPGNLYEDSTLYLTFAAASYLFWTTRRGEAGHDRGEERRNIKVA
jgi:hypothetical protein